MAKKKKKKKEKKLALRSTKKSATETRTATKSSSPRKKSVARKTKQLQGGRTSRALKISVQTLDALNERLDIMLPEVMFRIAALEHILVKNQLCSYEELVNARQFIQEQEAT